MPEPTAQASVRLAELLAVLSLGADLGMGQPMEHVMRQSMIALRMAERLGLDEAERGVVYYVSLLAWVGCHVDAYEQAKWFGDDLVMKGDFRRSDMIGFAPVTFMISHFGAGRPLLDRMRLGVSFVSERGYRDMSDMLENHWFAANELAERLGLAQDIRDSLYQTFERWDGKGEPAKAKGDELLMAARIVNLADVVEVFHRASGVDAAVSVARERSGTQFDPELVEMVVDEAPMLFADLDVTTTWDAVIAAEPALTGPLSGAELDVALEAIGDYTDVKSPFTLGHSRAVSALAAEAAHALGHPPSDTERVRRAGLVHDLGRLGVSNAIWDKRDELTPSERERIRLHPYLSERMLASSAGLVPLAELAVQHHERLDGSGYPRGVSGDAITPGGRILAAADAYRGKIESRPHRAALPADAAAAELRAQVRAGRLDGDAVDAVLRAAGHRVTRRRVWPAGLTTREVEVLRLLARGLSNKEIADELVISRKTAGTHVEHIYTKIGASNRARASLFAMRYGLMTDNEPPEDTANTR